ncbi:Cysteine/Histidine-rich C1 domain family protein, putative [Theobroma cacao]|uniref:Cysteine/Histidine-rich C1 domain family protein, putative n=1 Tax=Theobroma cacao TaxID=3641 RepID=A0A061F2E3_THECC|nr:Cysteine/Histidine-rich C1 domain family protein, putative [Theobroma cacao]
MAYWEIEHFNHLYPLSYYDVIEKNEDVLCKACNLEIYVQAYGCECCKYYLHNQCTKLPYEVLHPLHPQLKLDVKCVTLTDLKNEGQKLKEMAKESKVCPFEQEHKLFFFNVRHKVKHNFSCGICFLPLLGLRHACFRCGYLLHESCLGFPWEMTLPFHPEHPFVNKDPCAWCLACFGPFQYRIIYNCEQCVFINLHLSCANSLWQAIGSKSHQHPLFYFGTECQKPLRQYLWNLSFL